MTYSQVFKTLGKTRYRDDIIGLFRARGGDRNRWNVKDMTAMADAITAVEDRIEQTRQDGDRMVLRGLRRSLEIRSQETPQNKRSQLGLKRQDAPGR